MAFNTIGLNEIRSKIFAKNDGDLIKNNEFPTIMNSELTRFSTAQYITFTVMVFILCGLSIVGNMGALYAIQRRKLRLFFRSCLTSLAISDLIQTVFMSTGYVAQFGAPYVQVWTLGEAMCICIPFVTTGAILAGSMTLVGIAMDRYFAVMSSILGSWNPSKTFCVVSVMGIWALSYGIASPMYSAYSTYKVYIVRSMGLELERDDADDIGLTLVEMCVSEKKSNAYYYVVVLAIIFIPTLVAFVWLNSIIANKLWIRRHSINAPAAAQSTQLGRGGNTDPKSASTPTPTPATTSLSATLSLNRKPQGRHIEMTQQQYEYENSCHYQGGSKICSFSTLTTIPTIPTIPTKTRSMVATTTTTITTTTTVKSLERETQNDNVKTNSNAAIGAGGNNARHISSREARHLRMFAIVLILMAVFIFFRLPAWLFLIMRMYGTYTRPVHWILHFSFGILTLTSCVLNPLLYTFLAETIQYTLLMKGKLCGLRRFFENSCGRNIQRCNSNDSNKDDDDNMTHIPKQFENVKKQNFSYNNQDDHNHDDNDNNNDVEGHGRYKYDVYGDSDDCCCCKDNLSKDDDGAKTTSRKNNDDSNAKVYTIIIPVP